MDKPRARNAPNRSVPIFRDEERAVSCDCNSHGAAPHLLIGYDESCHKIFIFPRGFATLIEKQTDNFITSPDRSVLISRIFPTKDSRA
jgi:hypothetical protein